MTQPTEDLQFEQATYGKAEAGVRCGMCNRGVGREYWQWTGRVVCDQCRQRLLYTEKNVNSTPVFAKAALQAAGVALACGIGYAIIVGLFQSQLAIVTIGIGWVVAKVIRKATFGISGRRYQVLAVALTYAASTMGFAPAFWKAMSPDSDKAQHAQVVEAPSGAPGSPATHEASPAEHAAVPVSTLAMFVVYFCGMLLAAPLLIAFKGGWLTLVIIGFGLWEAWQISRPVPMVVSGPYRPGAAPPHTAS